MAFLPGGSGRFILRQPPILKRLLTGSPWLSSVSMKEDRVGLRCKSVCIGVVDRYRRRFARILLSVDATGPRLFVTLDALPFQVPPFLCTPRERLSTYTERQFFFLLLAEQSEIIFQ